MATELSHVCHMYVTCMGNALPLPSGVHLPRTTQLVCIHTSVSPPATTCVCVCVLCVCVLCVCVCATWHGTIESHFTELVHVIALLLPQRLLLTISLITLSVVVDAFNVYAIVIRIDCLATNWTDSTLMTSPLHNTRSS